MVGLPECQRYWEAPSRTSAFQGRLQEKGCRCGFDKINFWLAQAARTRILSTNQKSIANNIKGKPKIDRQCNLFTNDKDRDKDKPKDCVYTKPASLRKYSMVNQDIQTASINEKIGFSIVALPVELTFLHSSHAYVIYKVWFNNPYLCLIWHS